MKELDAFLKNDKIEEEVQPFPPPAPKANLKPPEKKIKPKVEEEKIQIIEKRKRPANPKAVQDYIKQQKQKRVDQLKIEREKKSADLEGRKKKLEELRVRSLQLASASKRRKGENSQGMKIIDTEEEMSMSLGLKQIKPKISYNESVSNLRKKPEKIVTKPPETVEKIEAEPEKEKSEEVAEKIKPDEKLKTDEKIEDLKPPKCDLKDDLNSTLKKLAESLKIKMDEKDKQIRSRATSLASKSVKDPLSQKPSVESLRLGQDEKVVAIDVEAIQTLKEEFKQISKNFQTLHEIILGNPPEEKFLKLDPPPVVLKPTGKTDWLKSAIPHPHPYNVLTAVKNKWQLGERPPASVQEKASASRESSIYAENNKYDSDFEPSSDGRKIETTTEENYYSMKDNSGSDFSSSILDSDKQSIPAAKKLVLKSPETSIKESILSESVSKKSSKLSSYKENLILVPPDLKLVTKNLSNERLNNSNISKSSKSSIGYKPVLIEDLNNLVNKDSKSESTIAEIIDNLTESDRSVKVKRTN